MHWQLARSPPPPQQIHTGLRRARKLRREVMPNGTVNEFRGKNWKFVARLLKGPEGV